MYLLGNKSGFDFIDYAYNNIGFSNSIQLYVLNLEITERFYAMYILYLNLNFSCIFLNNIMFIMMDL